MIKRLIARAIFAKEFCEFRKKVDSSEDRLSLRWKDRFPCFNDKTLDTEFDRHYIYHFAWAARALADSQPDLHIDFSSSLYFCSMVSAFVPVKFYDYRPAKLELSNLTSEAVDLSNLPFSDQSIQSLSCMHVVEHIGLGRYGDRLDPEGDLKAIAELKRVLAVGGQLLFVVPVGKARIMFNAHRIYSYRQVLAEFSDLTLKETALIPDSAVIGGLIRNADEKLFDQQSYGCGCFWFSK